MRRLDTNTKEIICWVRSSTVQANERLEFFADHYSMEEGGEVVETMSDVTHQFIEGCKDTLTKAIAIEVMDVVNSFDLDKGYVSEKGSAFPHLAETSKIDFKESITDYITDIIEDILNLPSIPAIAIIDELEEWLNDLYDFHLELEKESE